MRHHTVRVVGIVGLALALAAGPVAQTDSAAGKLRVAMDTEMVDGDLRAAIRQYQAIVDRFATDRAVVAAALVRMAGAHQKLGDAEAQAIYQRVLRDFTDQAEAVATARARLTTRDSAATVASEREVLQGPSVSGYGTPSADGRFMTYIDSSTQQVILRDLRANASRPLTSGGQAQIARDAPRSTALSRDGRQVAFEWAVPGSGQIELRIASTQGTRIPEPQRLFALSLSDAFAITPYDWSPDGRWILASIQTSDLVSQLTLVSAQDGSRRMLKSLTWTGPHRAFISPDSRYLAYSVPADDTLDESRVFVMAVDGSVEYTAVEHPSRNVVMGWAPDGASLLFASNRSGAFGLWSVATVDGQSRGAATLLKSNIGSSWSLGVTAAGSLLVWRTSVARSLQVAPVNLNTELAGGSPAASFQAFLGVGGNPVWSPDGQYLAYMASATDENFNSFNALTLRTADGRLVRTLPRRVAYLQHFAWSVDGRALIGRGRDLKGRWGTYRIDVQTGELTRVGEGLESWDSESAADRTTLATTSLDETKRFLFSSATLAPDRGAESTFTRNPPSRLLERDVVSKAERILVEAPARGVGPFLSPDGRLLAFGQESPGEQLSASERALFIMPATGGAPRGLLRGFRRVLWMPDSRALLVLKAPPERQELWVVPIDGSAPRRVGIDVHDPSAQIPYSLRSDGRQIAFVAGDAALSRSAIWMIENVLPTSTAAR